MKPRLRLKHGVWSCTSYVMVIPALFVVDMQIGYGYTPLEAYRDWEEQR